MDKEIWKDIEGYEGLYQVSNMGRVRSLKDNRGKKRILIMKKGNDRSGYEVVKLRGKTKHGKLSKVHRLVATAFIPNPENKPQVNHINGVKNDNCVENLEWCTAAENTNHAIINKLIDNKGEKSVRASLKKIQVEKIRNEYIPFDKEYGERALSKKYGVGIHIIKNIVRNKTYVSENYVLPPKTKITEEQVEEIRREYIAKKENYNFKKTAQKYGVTQEAIWAIARNRVRKNKNYIPPPIRQRKLSEQEVREIRNKYIAYDREYGAEAMAQKYNLSPSTLHQIIKRKIYKNVK